MTMKTPQQWRAQLPVVGDMMDLKEIFWRNPRQTTTREAMEAAGITAADIEDAAARLERFAPYIRTVFPETAASGGIIESPLTPIPHMRAALGSFPGRLLLKQDSHLPISGSIKARGGIYEVLHLAEEIAIREGKLSVTDDYSVLARPEYRELFSKYAVAVGSTGNLGLSIGIMSAMLGFRVTVHMSADARQWKKDMLRSKGVIVVEYADDYSKAVAEGRRQAALDPMCHFVDDENSSTLFLGYAVAALRLEKQLAAMDVAVDADHPLFVYLPCGVGGGPGGVAFGLKQRFGDHVHCFFAEPTHSPSMTLGLVTGLNDGICVQDVGIDNLTAADGLACGRPSSFVGRVMGPMISGCFTVEDERMYRLLAEMADTEGIRLEPSALAGIPGMGHICGSAGAEYVRDHALNLENAVHIAWATGGSMVPDDIWQDYYSRGAALR